MNKVAVSAQSQMTTLLPALQYDLALNSRAFIPDAILIAPQGKSCS
jgi:hypothetical protein